MIDVSSLNSAQLEAVAAPDGPVLVVAGAGSGKTRTLVHRMAWLVQQGVSPETMLLLTFTRKASREMLVRAADLLGYDLGGVHGGTFHAFAYSTLRRSRPEWAQGPVTVMDAADALAAVRQCRERLRIGKGDRSFPRTQTVIALLSKARNKEIPLADALRREAPHLLPHADALEELDEAYRAYRREHALLDYDDLLFELEDLLRGGGGREGAAAAVRERCRYLMVDEYQDTNKVQARIVRLLAGENGNVMAVGDDAQSIYAFRGAEVRNILDFPRMFPNARIVRLEENYRSTQPVLDVANAVLAPAAEGFRKRLFTSRKVDASTPKVRLTRPLSDLTQADLVASRVEELLLRYQAREIAVLFRAGYQSYHLEVALAKRGIGFRKQGGLRYAEAVHVKDAVAFVRLVVNPLDMPSFLRVAGLSKGVGTRTAQKIYLSACRGDSEELAKLCARFPELKEDLSFVDGLRGRGLSPAELVETVVEHYEPRMRTLFPDDWPRRRQGLDELARIASAYDELEAFVADLSLEPPEEGGEGDDEEERVVLSTIHSAKGLEWDAVILIDLVEERFPSRRAMVREEDFEEERRLMYVACTRARESLDLFVPSSLRSRQSGAAEPVEPSPFVRDLPRSAIEEWREGWTGRAVKRETPGFGFSEGRRAFGEERAERPTFLPSWDAAETEEETADEAEERPTRRIPVFAPRAPKPEPAPEPEPKPEPEKTRSSARTDCGFCRHKIFGRGKIVEQLPPDKCRVNFPGFGLKVIMKAYLTLED